MRQYQGKKLSKDMIVPPNIYEYKTEYQANVEKFSAEVVSNSRQIRATKETPSPADEKKQDKSNPDKKVSNQVVLELVSL